MPPRFTGWEIGVLQSVREIPGFLAFTAVFWFMLMREQTLAYVSVLLLAVGIAATGYFPSYLGLALTTFVMSVGFHYFETANQALSLQLLPKSEAPKVLGRIASAMPRARSSSPTASSPSSGGGSALLRDGLPRLRPRDRCAHRVAGMAVVPRFEGDGAQNKGIVLRRRYWLYYALTFLSGARRQLFMAFGGWLLVERFGYDLASLLGLLFIYCAINLVAGPLFGRLIGRIGERATIILENVSLIVVFVGYAITTSGVVAGALFVLDGVFFTLTIAQRTYFQKIADPADIAPTASVAFTINHIAAVAIPVVLRAALDPGPDARLQDRGRDRDRVAGARLPGAAPPGARPGDGVRPWPRPMPAE
jgi:hypothetical protein